MYYICIGTSTTFLEIEVEVEVCPSNFSWRRRGRGGVEVRYSIYLLGRLPHFGGVVEVEVNPSNLSWRERGRGGVKVRYSICFV